MTISLRDEVQKALAVEWPKFAADHPRLAAAVDQTLLVEQAVASIADSAEFRSAMEEAATAQSGGWLTDLVRQFVMKWVGKLL